MSGVLLDPVSLAARAIRDAEEERRAQLDAQLDAIAYACRREREVWCYAPDAAFLARAAVLSILHDRLYADLARRARKPSPATAPPGDRPVAPAQRKPGARRRRRRRR